MKETVKIQERFETAVQQKVATGIAASYWSGPDVCAASNFISGNVSSESKQSIDTKTQFDLASLTKVFCGTLLCAKAIEGGKLDLDEKPWPNWPNISLRNILAHNSGLPGWKPFYREAMKQNALGSEKGKEVVVGLAEKTSPERDPGEKTQYSDIGFLALTGLLEKRLGEKIDVLTESVLEDCIGKNQIKFRAFLQSSKTKSYPPTASTGKNPWLKHAFENLVHDPNCYAMGGVSTHAGLFGNLLDVQRIVNFILQTLLDPVLPLQKVLADFAVSKGERPLGFDCPTEDGTTGGVLSGVSVGHLGFTGTSFWVDPNFKSKGAAIVLLTNRVYFGTLKSEAIKNLRIDFHRLALG